MKLTISKHSVCKVLCNCQYVFFKETCFINLSEVSVDNVNSRTAKTCVILSAMSKTTHTFPDVINKVRSLTSDTFKFVILLKNLIYKGYDLAT